MLTQARQASDHGLLQGLLTAATVPWSPPELEPSSAPIGDRHTAFTGRLLNVLRDGIPEGAPVIDADALFGAVRTYCRAAALPQPVRQVRADSAAIPLVSNPAHRRNP